MFLIASVAWLQVFAAQAVACMSAPRAARPAEPSSPPPAASSTPLSGRTGCRCERRAAAPRAAPEAAEPPSGSRAAGAEAAGPARGSSGAGQASGAAKARAAPPAAGRSSRPAPAAGSVIGPLPPVTSSTGRRYYAFELRHGGPAVVAGYPLASALLDGNWGSRGWAPRGFATAEDAVNFLASRSQQTAASSIDRSRHRSVPIWFE